MIEAETQPSHRVAFESNGARNRRSREVNPNPLGNTDPSDQHHHTLDEKSPSEDKADTLSSYPGDWSSLSRLRSLRVFIEKWYVEYESLTKACRVDCEAQIINEPSSEVIPSTSTADVAITQINSTQHNKRGRPDPDFLAHLRRKEYRKYDTSSLRVSHDYSKQQTFFPHTRPSQPWGTLL